MLWTEALIREAKRKILSLLHDGKARLEYRRVWEELKRYDPTVINNQTPTKKKQVVIVFTRLVRFSGGQTSALRLGTELAKQGFDVIYTVYKKQSKEEMAFCAKSNLASVKGKFYPAGMLQSMIKKQKGADIVIATSWDTVSFVKKLSGYKMYFVQDYEPYFYPFGELSLLAKKTYEQGLHMVSLGAWNKEVIEKNCHIVSKIDVVDFPYEKGEYPEKKRDFLMYAEKKTLIFAVNVKYYGKRLPCIIQNMMKELAECFQKDNITLDVRYYGEAKSFHTKGGRNLGMLTKKELSNLYQKADFGMVASMSNISLIPYEMLSSGLPVIEFEDGTFSYFFSKPSAILTGLSGKELYIQLKKCIHEPDLLKTYMNNASKILEGLSWKRTGEQFAEIIRKL